MVFSSKSSFRIKKIKKTPFRCVSSISFHLLVTLSALCVFSFVLQGPWTRSSLLWYELFLNLPFPLPRPPVLPHIRLFLLKPWDTVESGNSSGCSWFHSLVRRYSPPPFFLFLLCIHMYACACALCVRVATSLGKGCFFGTRPSINLAKPPWIKKGGEAVGCWVKSRAVLEISKSYTEPEGGEHSQPQFTFMVMYGWVLTLYHRSGMLPLCPTRPPAVPRALQDTDNEMLGFSFKTVFCALNYLVFCFCF